MSRMRIDDSDITNAQIFEILLDNFPDIIHSVDDSGNIVFTNRKAESLLGYARDELLSMKVREIYSDEVLKKVDEGFSELKKKGDYAVESILKAKDGTCIPVEIRSFSIYDDYGNFLRTFSILRDIRPIKELQNSLVHAGRLAAIGEMASGVAHDINNPLTVILLANEMIGRKLQRSDSIELPALVAGVSQSSSEIQRASQSIQKLVQHLRNFSRGMAEKYEVLDLRNTISDSLFMTASKIIKYCIEVRNDISAGIHYTNGSPNQLEQVFVNLISNACDAMSDREERVLTIIAKECQREDKPFWQVDISDSGTGIKKELLDDIFRSFFTTKEKGKGTGLGLSISRGILRDHGGNISVSSEAGKGTTFSVYLPKHDCSTA
ncbi:MAG: PAS domain S-box protein [Lentisphaerales bacterium]|nr:MAG: PAS domain S-box protein [Lentisphaerales bacterium]